MKILFLAAALTLSSASKADIYSVIQYQKDHPVYHDPKFGDVPGDLDRNVLFGAEQDRILVGEADLKRTQQLLNELNPSLNLAPAAKNGKATILIQTYLVNDTIGCGCPTGFTDTRVVVVLEGKSPFGPTDGQGTLQAAATWSISNNVQRQASMTMKFGSTYFIGSPGFIGNTGFYVTDFEGNQILTAKAASKLPDMTTETNMDAGVHTLGAFMDIPTWTNPIQKSAVTAKFYRMTAHMKQGTRPFNPAAGDVFKLKSQSSDKKVDLATQLHFIGYQPKTWMAREVVGDPARVWFPVSSPLVLSSN
jgi:hypothetical protein